MPIALAAIALIIGSAIWAHYRFARFDRLPAQYGARLEPNWFAPAWVVIWGLPVSFVGVLALVCWLVLALPPEQVNGDPALGIIIVSVATVGVQAFTLWLTARWARTQS